AHAMAGTMRSLRALGYAGLSTFGGSAPADPPTAGWTPERIADAFASAGAKKMFSRLLGPRWGARDAMLARLAGSPLEEELRRISDIVYMDSFLDALADACDASGVDFRRWRDDSSRNEFAPRHTAASNILRAE